MNGSTLLDRRTRIRLHSIRTSDPDMRVEESDVPGLRARHVDLDEDGAREDILHREDEVGELRDARVPWAADLDDGFGVLRVLKKGPSAAEFSVGFSP